jgi:hypothetical protein
MPSYDPVLCLLLAALFGLLAVALWEHDLP